MELLDQNVDDDMSDYGADDDGDDDDISGRQSSATVQNSPGQLRFNKCRAQW